MIKSERAGKTGRGVKQLSVFVALTVQDRNWGKRNQAPILSLGTKEVGRGAYAQPGQDKVRSRPGR